MQIEDEVLSIINEIRGSGKDLKELVEFSKTHFIPMLLVDFIKKYNINSATTIQEFIKYQQKEYTEWIESLKQKVKDASGYEINTKNSVWSVIPVEYNQGNIAALKYTTDGINRWYFKIYKNGKFEWYEGTEDDVIDFFKSDCTKIRENKNETKDKSLLKICSDLKVWLHNNEKEISIEDYAIFQSIIDLIEDKY